MIVNPLRGILLYIIFYPTIPFAYAHSIMGLSNEECLRHSSWIIPIDAGCRVGCRVWSVVRRVVSKTLKVLSPTMECEARLCGDRDAPTHVSLEEG